MATEMLGPRAKLNLKAAGTLIHAKSSPDRNDRSLGRIFADRPASQPRMRDLPARPTASHCAALQTARSGKCKSERVQLQSLDVRAVWSSECKNEGSSVDGHGHGK